MIGKWLKLLFGRSDSIAPIENYCAICFEEGKLRSCCKTVYCDYDYTKNKSCPNCHNDTKKDKVSGAVFMVSKYSEFEECRICLGAGLKRRCCGNYYCDDCYCKSNSTIHNEYTFPLYTPCHVFSFLFFSLISFVQTCSPCVALVINPPPIVV